MWKVYICIGMDTACSKHLQTCFAKIIGPNTRRRIQDVVGNTNLYVVAFLQINTKIIN